LCLTQKCFLSPFRCTTHIMSFLAFEKTRELTRVVRSAQAALDAIDELMNSLFEFGGESAGRVCSIATSIAKGAFSETKVQLLMVRNRGKPKT
jgi:hypothetical protein